MLRAPDLAGLALDGRYELRDLLGEGAFGRVYRGVDLRLGRVVAVKVIKPWWAEDSAWVERFQREARLLARVSDPGVVQIFDIGNADEGPYLVAELVDGESLDRRLRRGALAPERARDIAEGLCRALAAAHREGVVHCDVKPANVLLASDGSVKVGDFGVARLVESTSQGPAATIAGTPRYMSPEQARGRPTTPATDVYSAGVVLYEMLAGAPPFVDGSPVELGLRHLQDPPPPLPADVPAPLRALTARALAKSPRERYADGGEMADALAALRAARGTTTAAADVPIETEHPSEPVRATEPADLTAATWIRPDSSRTRLLPRPAEEPPTVAQPRPRRSSPRRARAVALVLLALAALAAAGTFLLGGAAATTVPQVRGLARAAVRTRVRDSGLRAAYSSRYDSAPAGFAIAQNPGAGAHVAAGSTLRVVLSAGPPPVAVPAVVGSAASAAESTLAAAGLRYGTTVVAAPGSEGGVVVSQTPAPPARTPSGSTVALSIAETPRWRALTTFSGVDDGESVPFHILGRRWRVTYGMSFRGTCLLLVVCGGPSAEARNAGSGAGVGGFELEEGESQSHVFTTGPGVYRLDVSGGRDSARWTMTVEDYY